MDEYWHPDTVIKTVSYMEWFVDFASTHKVYRAKAELLPATGGISVDVPVQAVEPPLPVLTAAELKAAREYRAPASRTSRRAATSSRSQK